MKKIKYFILIILLNLIIPNVFAAHVGVSGTQSVIVGNEVSVTIAISGIDSANPVKGVQGVLSYDTSKLTYISHAYIGPGAMMSNYNASNGRFLSSYTADTPINSGASLFRVTFRANATGTASLSVGGLVVGSVDNTNIPSSGGSMSVTIKDPPSGNNYLSSLSVSPGSISFNKNTTSYNVSVDEKTSGIAIYATPEDSKASVAGAGPKNLNYGSNSFSLTVTAENGERRTYTINVNRKDPRSDNATLSNLSVSNGKLSPGFSPNTTNYSMEVPFEVSSLNISTKTQNDKASVRIEGNNLVAEKTTTVRVVVTAENGATKTYSINVKRGKDPNKILSTNNYLSSFSIDNGILSPAFNKEQLSYIVYLPYEIDTINFSYTVEDTEYATTSLDGNKSLSVGNNIFNIAVKAEDESIRNYSITVIRGKNVLGEVSEKALLQSLKLSKGRLKGKFNSETFIYYYTPKKGITFDAKPNLEDATVSVIDNGNGVYNILVTSSSGVLTIYTLIPKTSYLWLIILVIIIIILIIIYIIIKRKKDNNKDKKGKKEKINKKEEKTHKK